MKNNFSFKKIEYKFFDFPQKILENFLKFLRVYKVLPNSVSFSTSPLGNLHHFLTQNKIHAHKKGRKRHKILTNLHFAFKSHTLYTFTLYQIIADN